LFWLFWFWLMLSLYIHIPFCVKNCPYCSFSVVQNPDDEMIQNYLNNLHNEIDERWKVFWKAEIRTIYFGWWTPNLIWAEEIRKLIHHCEENFDCENVGELSFECNPFPQYQVYEFISQIQKSFKKYPRVRFSFWIQSLDNWVLENAGRPYTFPWMVDFLRGLRDLKLENSVYNFDFMAFGVFNQTKKWDLQLWTSSALEFFQDFVNSWFADSFSLYMLELFEHQKWKKSPEWSQILSNQTWVFWNEDEIYEEFDILKNIIQEWWYKRYEISNFTAVGKSSIHNRVYREMEDYLWLWLSASSFINGKSLYFWNVIEKLKETESLLWPHWKWIRWTNTPYFPKYIWNEKLQKSEIKLLSEKDYLIESFFLWLRTDRWIDNVSKFEPVLVNGYQEKLNLYGEGGFLKLHEKWFILTDNWMDCYNEIITELLNEV
jgi:oxygen-independent coproporphyrinogen-3 oxidase